MNPYESPKPSAGTIGEDGQDVIGLLFPTGEGEDDCETRYMTLPAAKALLLDLRDAIEAAVKHQRGESME